MMTLHPFPGTTRATYPGEYTPDPFLFEGLKGQESDESFQTKSSLFSHVNISEDSEYYKIELETPGLTRKDLLVRINERGNLFVAGIQKSEMAMAQIEFGIHSKTYSGFSRELALPENIDTDFIKAECRFGILTIWFLKTGKPYPKRPSLVVVY